VASSAVKGMRTQSIRNIIDAEKRLNTGSSRRGKRSKSKLSKGKRRRGRVGIRLAVRLGGVKDGGVGWETASRQDLALGREEKKKGNVCLSLKNSKSGGMSSHRFKQGRELNRGGRCLILQGTIIRDKKIQRKGEPQAGQSS